MKKTIGLIIILGIMLIMLTGCAEINYEVTINKDGSGEIFYIYGISKDILGNSTELVEELVSSAKEQSEEKGYIVDLYENEEISGFKASKKLTDVTKDFSINEIFEVFGEDAQGNTKDSGIIIEKTLFKTKFLQNAEIDLNNVNSDIKVEYTVNLPTRVGESNANLISEDGKTLTWEVKTKQLNVINFEATQINALPIIIIVLGVAVIVGGLVTFINLKKKHVTKNEK